jgi:hypothetical protein
MIFALRFEIEAKDLLRAMQNAGIASAGAA